MMHEYRYFFIFVLLVSFCIVAWIYRWNIIHLRKHSYEDLVKEKEILNSCIWDWRYPDGSFVPQHKRQEMFRDLQRLSRRIRKHPNNPSNIKQSNQSEEV